MNANRTVTANYRDNPVTHTLTVNSINPTSGVTIDSSTGHGGFTSYTRRIIHNTGVTLTAPRYLGSGASRKSFSHWWDGTVKINSREITFTMGGNRIYTAFYVNDPVTSLIFNHNFNSANGYHGWVRNPQNRWSLSSTALVTGGVVDKMVTAYNPGSFNDFDYSVRMRRINGSPVNAVTFRSGNSFNFDRHIYPTYRFGYSNGGTYNIMRCNANGTYTVIQNWTESSSIVRNGWNTLRVVANGRTFNCYINGRLVRTFTDGSFSSGRVGIAMWRIASDPSTTRLQVDWATLSRPPASAALDVVSPEQEALNKAAMESETDESRDHHGDYNPGANGHNR